MNWMSPYAAERRRQSERERAVSVYGFRNRMPVTLYMEQWERLIGFVRSSSSIKDNESKLKRKDKPRTHAGIGQLGAAAPPRSR